MIGSGKESLLTSALRMCQKFPEFWGYVISLYFSITNDIKGGIFCFVFQFFSELRRWCGLCSITTGTVRPARWKGCLHLFANWLRQKLPASFKTRPFLFDHKCGQVGAKKSVEKLWHHCIFSYCFDCTLGQESEEKWCPGYDQLLWLQSGQHCGWRIPSHCE